MIEWLWESLWFTFIIMVNMVVWAIVGGFFINLWEVMLDWWNEVFFKWRK